METQSVQFSDGQNNAGYPAVWGSMSGREKQHRNANRRKTSLLHGRLMVESGKRENHRLMGLPEPHKRRSDQLNQNSDLARFGGLAPIDGGRTNMEQ